MPLRVVGTAVVALATALACAGAVNARRDAAPANDMFANAQVVSGTSGTVTGSNVGATKESGEPNHAGNAGGASIWYRWTPSATGSVTVDTTGSSFDTLLAVYTGGAVNALTAIASNDDCCGGRQSKVTFNAAAGTTYQIAVDGYNKATGNVTLHWSQVAPPAHRAPSGARTSAPRRRAASLTMPATQAARASGTAGRRPRADRSASTRSGRASTPCSPSTRAGP